VSQRGSPPPPETTQSPSRLFSIESEGRFSAVLEYLIGDALRAYWRGAPKMGKLRASEEDQAKVESG